MKALIFLGLVEVLAIGRQRRYDRDHRGRRLCQAHHRGRLP